MHQAVAPSSVTTEDYAIDGPHGVIPLRIYRPATCPSSALLWMHGGGFRHGSIDMQEAHGVSAELAARATALVVSVDYRLAGDGVTFPVPLDDVYAAWKWLASFADSSEIGIRALGGASAGAALALAAALRGRDDSRPADRLLLAYPFAHYPNPAIDDETAREMAALPGILRFPRRRSMRWSPTTSEESPTFPHSRFRARPGWTDCPSPPSRSRSSTTYVLQGSCCSGSWPPWAYR